MAFHRCHAVFDLFFPWVMALAVLLILVVFVCGGADVVAIITDIKKSVIKYHSYFKELPKNFINSLLLVNSFSL